MNPETNNAKVQVRNLTKKFGDLLVLNDMSFDIKRGEFVCIVGPTGCGKTTFLMLLDNMTVAQIAATRCVEVVTIKSQIHTMLKKFQMKRTKEVTSHIRMLELEQLFDGGY